MKPQKRTLKPSFAEEGKLLAEGYRLIAGVDEVGRGALAGPLVAAAVILPCHFRKPWLKEVRDSKLLTAPKREYLFSHIQEVAVAVSIGTASHEIIDAQGIAMANRIAMKQAVDSLLPHADSLLIDFFKLPEVNLPQKGIVDGDTLCFSIACASIIAKVTRDRLMLELDQFYPGYGLCHHKGYGTREHWSCLEKLGLSPIHRHSFCLNKTKTHDENEYEG